MSADDDILVTFDIDVDDDSARDDAYNAIETKWKLSKLANKVRLPYTTVIGPASVFSGKSTKQVRDEITAEIERASRGKVTRIAVARVSDWSVFGEKSDELRLREIISSLIKLSLDRKD